MQDIVKRTYDDIRSMKIRGAMDIAVSVAEVLKRVASESKAKSTRGIVEELIVAGEKLKSARPTAVAPPNAVDYIVYAAKRKESEDMNVFKKTIEADIGQFIKDQKKATECIAKFGSDLIEDGDVILTHCNSDSVVEIIKYAHNSGKRIEAVCTETRPRHQGYITAKQLSSCGIRTTLIIDSAVLMMIEELGIRKVFVGADAVLADGRVINKIGTSQVALCAKEKGVDFFVAAQAIKFAPKSIFGESPAIEERSSDEITRIPRVAIKNPAFDITPPSYIRGIITDSGVIAPEKAHDLIREKFKWSLDACK